jgi:hypothetical protein
MKFGNRKIAFANSVNAPVNYWFAAELADPDRDLKHEDILEAIDKIRYENRLQNDSTGADSSVLADLQALATMDVQTYAEQVGTDISGQLFNDINNPDATDPTYIRNLMPYTGEMDEIAGSGDRFPLMREPTDDKQVVPMKIVGIANRNTLRNALFNSLYDVARVTTSAGQMYNDSRNLQFFKPVIAALAGLGSANIQAADTTGTTKGQKIYNTLMHAIELLYGLKNALVNRKVSALQGENIIICTPKDALQVKPIVAGSIGRETAPQLFTPLNAQVIEWPGAVLAKSTYELADGTALLIKKPNIGAATRLNKRDLVALTGETPVEEGKMDASAWYRATGEYLGSLLPSDNTGNGMIVKINLPQ